MKHLSIVVDGNYVFDGEVAEITWTDNGQQVTVTGKFTAAPSWIEALRGLKTGTPVADSIIDGGATDED